MMKNKIGINKILGVLRKVRVLPLFDKSLEHKISSIQCDHLQIDEIFENCSIENGPKDDIGGFSIDTKRSYQHGPILSDPQPSMTPQQQTKQPIKTYIL